MVLCVGCAENQTGTISNVPLSQKTINPTREAVFDATKEAWLLRNNMFSFGTPEGTIQPDINGNTTQSSPYEFREEPTKAPNDNYLATVAAPSAPQIYTLQYGEWPLCIARRYNVNWDTFYSYNEVILSQDYITAGTELVIPQATTWDTSMGNRRTADHPTTYSVSVGETLGSIACYFGDITPEAIAEANYLSAGSELYAGQILNIP